MAGRRGATLASQGADGTNPGTEQTAGFRSLLVSGPGSSLCRLGTTGFAPGDSFVAYRARRHRSRNTLGAERIKPKYDYVILDRASARRVLIRRVEKNVGDSSRQRVSHHARMYASGRRGSIIYMGVRLSFCHRRELLHREIMWRRYLSGAIEPRSHKAPERVFKRVKCTPPRQAHRRMCPTVLTRIPVAANVQLPTQKDIA
jgi:hypothetical protein